MLKFNKPKQCDLSLPNQCMLRCKMCNFWKNDLAYKDSNWLGIHDYRKLLYEIRDFVDDPFLVSFGGGEPLLYADKLLDIVRICKEIGFRTYFPTNAYLIDEEMAKRIAQAGVFSIGISLDSLDRNTHDFLRGRQGCWERAIEAIELLKRHCPEVIINVLTIIMEANFDEIIDLTKWVYNHPMLHSIVFQAIQRPFNADSPENWYEFKEYVELWPRNNDRVNSVIDELVTLRKTQERGFKISNPIVQLEIFKLYFKNPKSFVKPARCHLGDDVIRVDSFGNVMFCDEMGFIGNVKESNAYKIWYSSEAKDIRNRIYNCTKNCYHLINCFYEGKAK